MYTAAGNFIQSINQITLIMKRIYFLLIAAFITTTTFAQNKDLSSNGDDTFNHEIEYSRPGKYHQLLADLVGSWNFKGSHFEWTDSVTSKVAIHLFGTAVRKSFANGRFFIVNMTTGGKIQLPIQDGKMIDGYGKGIQTEGYDNVKNKYQISYINNHLGSDIWNFEGTYDSTIRTITFDGEIELVPGKKTKNHFLFIFIDQDHYKWELDEEENGKYRKASEMNFTRVKGK